MVFGAKEGDALFSKIIHIKSVSEHFRLCFRNSLAGFSRQPT